MSSATIMPLGQSSRRVLEFDAVLALIAGHAQTAMGAARVRETGPQVDAASVQRRHEQIDELRRFAASRGYAALGLADPVDAALARVAARGMVLDAEELRGIARLARAAVDLRRHLPRDPEEWPDLATVRETIADLRTLVDQIEGLFTPDGDIRDDASPALQRLRRQARRLRTAVRGRLERMTRDDRHREALGDNVVTERGGRFVLPVRSGQRDRIPGVVHDTSSSGHTLFVEPLEMVEEQNRLAALGAQEREEIQRLLAEATAHVRAASEALRSAQSTIGEIDARQAVGRWAQAVDAVVPEFASAMRVRQAYHPLIDREAFVPLDLELPEGARGLVITGPNTGGKTVALKTLGLLVLLGQCGIPVPAAEARLPLFVRVHADIGDEQSIAASLSTFSAHMNNIVGFLRDAPAGTLVLLDELGTGTDPEEGAALGVALFDRLLELGATVVVSTHHDALKAFAHADERTVNAAMEFDPGSLAPTYRIRVGRPGRSNALDIAAGLGLDRELVDRARGLLRAESVKLDAVIERLEQENREAEAERVELQQRRREMEEALDLQQRSEQRRQERMVELERAARLAIREAVEELRQEASRRLSELQARQDSAPRSTPRSARSRADDKARWSGTIGSLEGTAMRDLRARLAAEAAETTEEAPTAVATPRGSAPAARSARAKKKPRAAESPSDASTGPLRRGDPVSVAPFDLHGAVLRDWSGEEDTPVEVDVGGKRLIAARRQLAPSTGRARRGRRGSPAATSGVGTSYLTRRDLLPEIDLHGMTVERALEVVDKYVDDAMLAEFSSVRLIHGYGTLRLRDAIHRWLASRPGIASYASAGPGDGGAGVTVVRLKG